MGRMRSGATSVASIGLARKCGKRIVATTIDGKDLMQCDFSAAMMRYCTFTENIENRNDLRELTFQPPQGYRLQNIPTPPNAIQFLEQRENQVEDEIEADTGGGGD